MCRFILTYPTRFFVKKQIKGHIPLSEKNTKQRLRPGVCRNRCRWVDANFYLTFVSSLLSVINCSISFALSTFHPRAVTPCVSPPETLTCQFACGVATASPLNLVFRILNFIVNIVDFQLQIKK